jgi:DHA2 family multidrug resistance protein-like MFS transporter
MLSIIYGVKRFAADGAGPVPLLAVAMGLGLAAIFVSRQQRLADPLIDMGLFRVPPFSAAVVAQMVSALSMGGIYLFVAQYLQLVLGLSPLQAGLALLPSNLGGIAGTMLAPFLVRRFQPAHVIAAGMVLAALGISVLTQVGGVFPVGTIVASFVVMSFGFSGAMTLTTDVIMSVAPPERAGAASGISETSAELGMALGVAVLGSVGTASYRSIMATELPAGLSSGEAERIRATLAEALEVTSRLSGPAGGDVAAVARDAFSQSLALVSAVSATMVIATSIVTLILLRRVGSGVEREGDPPVSATA